MTNAAGAVTVTYMDDAFGNLVASTGTTANPYGFTGEPQFGEADSLVFLRARYYQPATGRFLSRDPIGYKGGINLYAYVDNNPVIHTDASGLAWDKQRLCDVACNSLAAAAGAGCAAAAASKGGVACAAAAAAACNKIVYHSCMDICNTPPRPWPGPFKWPYSFPPPH